MAPLIPAPSRSKPQAPQKRRHPPAAAAALTLGAVGLVALGYAAPSFFASTYETSPAAPIEGRTVASAPEHDQLPPRLPARKAFLHPPEPLKAIYMSQCVVGTPSFREDLVRLIEETELNAVVIDIKDYTGKISFDTDHPTLKGSVSDACGARDMEAFLDSLRAKGIYTIGRITVFQDPFYAVAHPELAVKKASDPSAIWTDGKGLHFIDVGAKPYWEYIVELSKESRRIGFDELNYDYIRFPSDGPMTDIYFPFSNGKAKPVALEEFFRYLHEKMKDRAAFPESEPLPVISADIFGMTTTNTDDLNIGQQLEIALPYFDYIAPMVYPSHYPDGYNGWTDPNKHPYDLIKYVMSAAVSRAEATETKVKTLTNTPVMKDVVMPATASTPTTTQSVPTGMYTHAPQDRLKLRPWLQDFDYGGEYGPAEVRAQIQGTYDAGLTSWMLWAPSNRYTKEALMPH